MMISGGYAEVADAIRLQSTGCEGERRESVDQDYACIADEQPQETITEADGVTQTGNSSIRKSKGGKPTKPTVIPPPRQQSLAKEKVAGVCSGGKAVSRHSSTEHLYDSLDESLGSGDHLYHVLESSKTGNNPPLYHVLEGPTKVDAPDGGAEKALPKGLSPHPPAVPPKPLPGLANKHRVQSCVGIHSVALNNLPSTSGSVSHGKKSIQNQVSSVMAIYEEVPAEGKSRSSSSILLPPPLTKAETKSGAAEKEKKEPVYHILEECSSAIDASRGPSDTKEPQKNEQTVKTNSDNVFQKDQRENGADLNVCQTDGAWFHSELPRTTKQTPFVKAEECKYAEPISLKNKTETDHVCELFDDPAYCTQRHTTEKTVTDNGLPEEPSYATPSTGTKQTDSPSQPTPVLFDDPKYHSPVVGEAGAGKVFFDDPKYQPANGPFHTTQRRVSGIKRGVVRHSSSVEHFSSLIYSNTTDFLDASERKSRGGSLHDLTDKRCRVTGEVYMKVTHL